MSLRTACKKIKILKKIVSFLRQKYHNAQEAYYKKNAQRLYNKEWQKSARAARRQFAYTKYCLGSCGDNFNLYGKITIFNPQNIYIGNNVTLNKDCTLLAADNQWLTEGG